MKDRKEQLSYKQCAIGAQSMIVLLMIDSHGQRPGDFPVLVVQQIKWLSTGEVLIQPIRHVENTNSRDVFVEKVCSLCQCCSLQPAAR